MSQNTAGTSLDDKVFLLEPPQSSPPVLADHSGTPLVLQALREKLVKAEAEARESALKHHRKYALGLRAAFAIALAMLDHEVQAQKTQIGHKG